MLKASWTGLACFSTKQLTLLAVASVKASVHNNPSRIHWVCHNITFQDWSSKYEKTTLHEHNLTRTLEVWREFLGTITQIFTVATSRDLVISNTNPTNPNRLSQKCSLGEFLDGWGIWDPPHLVASWTWYVPSSSSWSNVETAHSFGIWFFEAVKFKHRKCYRKRHRFSTGPAVTLAPFPLRFPYFDVKETTFHWRFEPPWIERLGRCENLQAAIILKAANKENLGHMFVWKNNLEGWDLNKKVVKNRKLSSLLSDNPGPTPKALSIPWTADWKKPVTYGSPSHKDSRLALGRASPRKSRHRFLSVFSDTFGYFPLCPTCKPMLNACQHGNFIWVSRHSRSSFKVPSRVTESCRL